MPAETIHTARKREKDRERERREAKQGAFEASMLHIDLEESEMRDDSPSWLSDRGAGAEAVYAHADGETPETIYNRRIRLARKRVWQHLPESLEVFNLIIQNGDNKEESIWALLKNSSAYGTPPKSATDST